MATTITSDRKSARFASAMARLHRNAGLYGPEVASWAHHQREHWWHQEYGRRLARERSEEILARIEWAEYHAGTA